MWHTLTRDTCGFGDTWQMSRYVTGRGEVMCRYDNGACAARAYVT